VDNFSIFHATVEMPYFDDYVVILNFP